MNHPQEFDKLNVSTSTVMAYTNMTFDLKKIFASLPITPVVPTYTKKQRNINKKDLTAPYGAIVSVQSKTHVRGLDTRKKQKHWCTICRPTTTTATGKEKQILSCTESLQLASGFEYTTHDGVTHPLTDVFEITYFCSRCNKTYKASELKKISHFLNQTTLVFSLGRSPLLNVMIFRDSIKIAGCKDEQDAKDMIKYLWLNYLVKIPGFATLQVPVGTGTPVTPAGKPVFTFETVMKNLGFNLGFGILRDTLNILMNEPEYSHNVYMSEYESTGHTNVNIKMYSVKPKDFKYETLVFEDFICNTNPASVFTDNVINKKKVKVVDPDEEHSSEYVTFIVFSSSEVILSGRYTENMKEMYVFFRTIVDKHRHLLEEKLISE